MTAYFETVGQEINETRLVIDKRITDEVTSLRSDMQKIKDDMVKNSDTNLRADIDTLKKGMKDHEDTVDRKVDDKLHDATTVCLEEFREREQRKVNIIVFNVPESEKESVDDRKNDDLEYLRGMMSDVELNVPFSQVSRIGAQEQAENGPRPIKARTTCITDHRKILKVIPRFRETEGYGDIGIRREETPLERDQFKKLNAIRKQKEEESKKKGKTSNWIIRRGQVTKGRPRREGAVESK